MAQLLIIDDDKNLRSLLERVFIAEGHTVHLAADGREGCDRATELNPDLILTDLWMPKREGLETVRLIRNSAPDARIVVMSGRPHLANVSLFKLAKKNGANATIAKPFNQKEIVSLVKKVLANEIKEQVEA